MMKWKRKKLNEFCEFSNGLWTGKKPPFQTVGVIRNTNFTKDCLLDDSDIVYLEVEQSQFQKRKLQYGDIILEKSGGGPKQPVGRVVIFDKTDGDFSFSNFTSVIRIKNKDEVDFNFLHRCLFLEYISGATEKMQSHSTGIRNLKFDEYKEIEIPLPPLPEQQRIVSILDKAFSAIERSRNNAEQNLKNAKELFESYLQGIFENGNWETKKLNEITEVKDGTHDSPKYIKEGIPFVTQKNIKPDGFSFGDTKFITETDHEKFYKRSNVTYGDILISMIGANRGMAAIVDDKRVFSIKNVGLIKSSDNINMNYLLYYLKSSVAMKYVLYMSNGGAQEFVGLTALRSFPIPLPPLKEQQTIVHQLDALRAETQKLETVYQKKIADLEELKKSILQKAFNGELVEPTGELKIEKK
ncbi:restriction endonuclease subunit S [Bacteroidales bacterium OttesenSCG-928-B11]|nr:restriction endonuclease subunit S [Bacteroidales bacterium OttesenSCG-928-E04]MDL2308148.1 restriction endonuclease subunit S [Bacteroidales bacterium OttesenSCG-928-C03]MDL2311497.1 restriction endonuclease subunit S [Bacteroidales bacterium OttesenSCG-928-B11]MDL2325574.1 restriction endonuclease subunit S [Bacteroidales bacterium OttesenSCG-928-A14]